MPGKTIRFGDTIVEITDPANILPISADAFTEMWTVNGVVHLSFAALIRDGKAPAEARTVARLRLSIPTINDLHKSFSDILKREMPSKARREIPNKEMVN